MEFREAEDRFRHFLADHGCVGPILWVTPDDVGFLVGHLIVRPRRESALRADRLFCHAVQRGYGVALEAMARLEESICCFVFAPDNCDDAGDHFVAPPLTMKLRDDLRAARRANRLEMWAARRLSGQSAVLQFFGYELDQRPDWMNNV